MSGPIFEETLTNGRNESHPASLCALFGCILGVSETGRKMVYRVLLYSGPTVLRGSHVARLCSYRCVSKFNELLTVRQLSCEKQILF